HRQQQAGLLATGHQADLEIAALATEAEAAELGAHLGLRRAWSHGDAHVVVGRRLEVEAFFLVLRKITDTQLRRLLELADARLEALRDQADKGRFAVVRIAVKWNVSLHLHSTIDILQD